MKQLVGSYKHHNIYKATDVYGKHGYMVTTDYAKWCKSMKQVITEVDEHTRKEHSNG